ncbi:MAG: type III-B CRISPR module-associated protein Cmr5 [candidate division Zixibacteria bacterium]|jgi:CRISPR-associated protein Cmr5|nr:type III-B CRISPR module-associated protein Cmr5 [candidate division Zixibacteria bacterium]
MPASHVTRDQQRAQAAYERIMKVDREPWRKDYGRQCLNLPFLIQRCGLCQAITFLDSKSAADSREYLRYLLRDFAEVSGIADSQAELVTAVRGSSNMGADNTLRQYQWMTREALACSIWFKRYAEAVLKVQLGEGEDTDR